MRHRWGEQNQLRVWCPLDIVRFAAPEGDTMILQYELASLQRRWLKETSPKIIPTRMDSMIVAPCVTGAATLTALLTASPSNTARSSVTVLIRDSTPRRPDDDDDDEEDEDDIMNYTDRQINKLTRSKLLSYVLHLGIKEYITHGLHSKEDVARYLKYLLLQVNPNRDTGLTEEEKAKEAAGLAGYITKISTSNNGDGDGDGKTAMDTKGDDDTNGSNGRATKKFRRATSSGGLSGGRSLLIDMPTVVYDHTLSFINVKDLCQVELLISLYLGFYLPCIICV
jgi:hypothetical protein